MGLNKVLVTGADGFIGSHLVEVLLRDGADVRAFTCYNSFDSRGWLDRLPAELDGTFESVSGDVRDADAVAAAVKGCDTVLHLAALIAIPFSYQAPGAYVDTNVSGTLNILRAAQRHDSGKVICTSTSEVYGSAQYVPIDENHPLNAQSPYAATKIGADQLALSFARSFEMPVGLLRPFNTYGPRQSARAVIPTIISQIAAGANQIKLGALTPTRDFTFVRDTARGFIQAAASEATVGTVFNIGSDFEISIEDTARTIADAMGADIEIIADEARMRPEASEVDRLFADTSRAREAFGWAPEFGGRDGFARGIALTAEWFQDPVNLAGYRPGEYTV